MSGTVNISRDLFDHGVFKKEPLTEREAWVWMIMQARWKPTTFRAGDFVVDLDRGQLAASVRHMASKWEWTAPRVQRYLERLKKMNMICSKTDTGVTVITICNYDKFQSPAQTDDTGAIQDRYSTDTVKKKDVIREEGKEDSSPPKGPVSTAQKFAEFWEAYPVKAGKPAAQKNFIKAVKAGADPDRIIEGARRYARSKSVADGFAKYPQGWLTDQRWEDADLWIAEIDPARARLRAITEAATAAQKRP